MIEFDVGPLAANLIASSSILLIRLYALRRGVNLPRFREKAKRL
jgi:uncharacterized membrane protein YeiH